MALLLPKFSKKHIEDFLATNGSRSNSNLLFYRYLNRLETDKTAAILEKEFIPKADTSMLKHLRKRQDADFKQWDQNFPDSNVCHASFKLADRMVAGIGIPSSFETGLLLDWVHGFPFVNGEAIKGATRSFANEKLNTADGLTSEEFRSIFGTLNKEEIIADNVSAGKVIFFNAFPEADNGIFDIDIITCHYGPYYMNEPPETPGDWHNPIPVAFLCVKAGTSFRFAVASQHSSKLAQKAMEWLQSTLVRRGIGAKKRIGYGHFIPPKSAATPGSGEPVDSKYISLISKIESTDASKLPGMAEEIMKSIGLLETDSDQRNAAVAFKKKLNKKTLKEKKDKDWVKKLFQLVGGAS